VLVWVLRRNEERLRARTLNDSLTGLPNRFSFVERVDRALTAAARESRPIACLLMDLDDFDEINHSLGLEAGDRLLAAVDERLKESGGFTARLCGDEFAVPLGEALEKSSAAAAVQSIGESLRELIDVNGSEVLVSASIGVADLSTKTAPRTSCARWT
jgi:diguanylate cyclase (GGDEF)-like protein